MTRIEKGVLEIYGTEIASLYISNGRLKNIEKIWEAKIFLSFLDFSNSKKGH